MANLFRCVLASSVVPPTPTIPDGSTVTPTDDVQIWLNCADIWDETYTTINEVLADSTTLATIISDNNAVDYMVRSTTWVSAIVTNSTAMTDISNDNYCASTLLGNDTWCHAIVTSTYFTTVLNVSVPNMTSNTTPSGEVLFNNNVTSGGSPGTEYYKLFSGTPQVVGTSSSTPSQYFGYDFSNAVELNRVDIMGYYSSGTCTITVEYSDDKSTWTSVKTISYNMSESLQEFSVANSASHRYWRINVTNIDASSIAFKQIQFYAR